MQLERLFMCAVIGAASMVFVRGMGGSGAAGVALGILIITVINLLEWGK